MIAATPAWAAPAPIQSGLPPILPGRITAALTPLIAVPAESASAPMARINYVVPLNDGSGRLFMNDVNGVLYTAPSTGGTATAYLDLRAQNVGAVSGPDPNGPGFSGFAFHPNFAGDPSKPGYGVFYTSTNIPNAGSSTIGAGTGPTVVEIREWTTSNPAASTFQGASRVVLDVSGYADNHSNASIAFNPTAKPGTADYGNLYIASGDGHFNDADQNAQRLDRPQGKLLRIDPAAGANGAAYTIPADNPFLGQAGALPEIWAYGLRNPQTFGWDPNSGAMYINDLGQAYIEEVDVGIAGANYGWSQRQGTFATGYAYGQSSDDQNLYPLPAGASQGFTDPIAEYDHTNGNAIGSGFLYRGSAIPELDGMYVMQDLVDGRIFYFDPSTITPGLQPTISELVLTQNGSPLSLVNTFGYSNDYLVSPRVDARLSEDANGNLLDTLKANGEIYTLTDSTPVPEPGTLLLLGGVVLLIGRGRGGARHVRGTGL